MPFNGNGVFNRLYNWAADAALGVKILSTKMDAETNGIAAGLSNCVTRDGQSPPSADLPMGGKKLTNLANGTVSGDAVNYGQLQTYLSLGGGALTGLLTITVTADEALRLKSSAGSPFLSWYDSTGATRYGYIQFNASGALFTSEAGPMSLTATGSGSLSMVTGGATRFTINSAGVATFAQGVYVNGILRGSYQSGDEKFRMVSVGANVSPYLSAYNAAESVRFGYLQFTAGSTVLGNDAGVTVLAAGGVQGFSLDVNKDITGPRNITISGSHAIGDANFFVTLSGGANPQLGFDTNDYFVYTRVSNAGAFVVGGANILAYNAAGVSITGTLNVSGTTTFQGAAVSPSLISEGASNGVTFRDRAASAGSNTNGWLGYVSSGIFRLFSYSASVDRFSVDSNGDVSAVRNVTATGTVAAAAATISDANFGLSKPGSNPVITFDTNDTITYDRTNNKFFFNIGGTAVASIDASGNLKVAGTITASTTP